MVKRKLLNKTSELKITVSANKVDWKAEQKLSKDALIKELKIDGFRKGKVPDNLIYKYISDKEIWRKAAVKMIDSLIKEAAKEIKENEIILDSPSYSIEKITAIELEVTFIYPIYPKFKIADYKNLKIKYTIPVLEKKAIDNELENLIKNHSVLKIVERKAKNGDIVKFDFEGFVSGKSFDGGKSENYELELGSGKFIPGFEEQLIDTKTNDKKNIIVTFPKDYHSKDLANKEAVFKCLIHEVKEKKKQELNDNFAQSLHKPGVKTLDELRLYIKNLLIKQSEQKAREDFKEEAFTEIKKNSDIIVSAQLITKEMKNQEKKFLQTIKQQGLDKKKYLKMTGKTEEDMNSQFKIAAKNLLIDSLIFAEIAKLEKIKLTDIDYDKEYQNVAKIYGQSVQNVKQTIQKQQLQIYMTNNKVLDILIKNIK